MQKKKKKKTLQKFETEKCLFLLNFTSLFPVIEADLSDSGCVDNVLELLVMAGGRSLPEVWFYLIMRQANPESSLFPRAPQLVYNISFILTTLSK